MKKVKYRKYIILFFVSLTVVVISTFCLAEDQDWENRGWENIGKWLEWKMKSELPQEQKDIVDYFEKAGDIQEKAEEINKTDEESVYSSLFPNPDKAVELLDNYIKEWNTLKPPELCKKHHEAGLRSLEVERKYQETRKKHDGWNEELGKITVESLQYDSTMFSEFWRILNEVGFMDNLEEEWIELGIMTREDIEEEYGFFKEYKKDSTISCPECGHNMRRVEMLYEGDANYVKSLEENSQDFLWQNERFEGCPEFGYRCDNSECKRGWFEEYPSEDEGKITIRNWCWGWHELVYRKKQKQ